MAGVKGTPQRREGGERIDDALAHSLLGDKGTLAHDTRGAGFIAYKWSARPYAYRYVVEGNKVRVRTLMRTSDVVRHLHRTPVGAHDSRTLTNATICTHTTATLTLARSMLVACGGGL